MLLLKRRKDSKLLRTWKTDMRKGRQTNNLRRGKLAERYAHRGFHKKPEIPENSMAAFRRALEHGFPVEFDVHLIADGSLVIFHDDDLERETGVKGQIEDYDITNLRKLRLEGTDEQIPTFDEVLDLFEDSGLPLLIELKVARGNYKALAEAVCKRLDSYRGEFVIESFDPRALIQVRKLRPDFIRGQLAQNFFRNREGLPFYQAVMLTHLMFNMLARPDFIAFRFEDIDFKSVRNAVDKRGLAEASWTITTPGEYKEALRRGAVPIFEQFDPEEL